MNKVILLGRLTKDIELKVGSNGEGKAYTRFNIAVDRKVKGSGQNADFPSCIAFGKTAEILEKYCHQGSRVCLEGRIQTGSYKDGERTIYTQDVVVESMEFAESKSESAKAENGFTDVNPADTDGLPFH